MIEVRNLTKRYGDTIALRGLSFDVTPGHVTGFLGPNGAGKSTTMRLIMGLDIATGGFAKVSGRRYPELPTPLQEVGALLDPHHAHPGRSARNHLLALARSNRLPASRVDDVLGLVGLSDVAHRRVGGFSLGMSQRLGVAAAVLGDPAVLLFDEPANGLDTEGIRWIRAFMQRMAAEGRTVFVASHLMSEMELCADRLVVIGRGQLLTQTTVETFIDTYSPPVTMVDSVAPQQLRDALERFGADVDVDPSGSLLVSGASAVSVGTIAHDQGVALHELRPVRSTLEDVYSRITAASVDYLAGDVSSDRAGAARR